MTDIFVPAPTYSPYPVDRLAMLARVAKEMCDAPAHWAYWTGGRLEGFGTSPSLALATEPTYRTERALCRMMQQMAHQRRVNDGPWEWVTEPTFTLEDGKLVARMELSPRLSKAKKPLDPFKAAKLERDRLEGVK